MKDRNSGFLGCRGGGGEDDFGKRRKFPVEVSMFYISIEIAAQDVSLFKRYTVKVYAFKCV